MPAAIALVAESVAAFLPAIGPVSLAAGAGFGIPTGTFALAQGITYTGLAIGASALSRALAPKTPGGVNLAALNTPENKVTVKQATPFQRIIRGRQRTGGPIVLYRPATGDGENSKLIIQCVYSRRKVMGLLGVNLNGFKLSFGSSPFGTILSPSAIEGQPDFPGHVRACFQDGRLNQPTNPLLLDIYPDLPAGWRLPGIPNATYEFEFGADYDTHTALYGNVQIPEVEPEFDGCPVYDPRDPSQFLPRDPNDIEEWFAAQESWKLSYNAALHQADHIWQPDGLNARPDAVDWEKVAEAANRADEAVATRDTPTTMQFEKRYECHGVVGMDQGAADVMDGLLVSSRACLVQGANEKCWPSHDAPKKPVLTITDDMIIGDVSYRGFKALGDLANETTMEFVAPDRKYQMSQGPQLIRTDLILEDGKELALNVSLPFIGSPSMAQRIAKADLLDARIEQSWSGTIKLEALGIHEDDCVRIASKICPHWNGLYIVSEGQVTISLRGDSGISLSLIGYVPENANNWNAANDDQPFVITDTDEELAA